MRCCPAKIHNFVRHPADLAMPVAVPSWAMAPGSWIAWTPAARFLATIAKRARIEDEFLCKIWLATSPPRLKFEAACSPKIPVE